MEESELVAKYPTCFHLASADAWESVQQLGLLSTRALLDVWEVPSELKTRLITQLRKGPEHVAHPVHGSADIRDQHPMNEAMLRRSLADMTVQDWLTQLNSHVFFAPTRRRLESLYAAYHAAPRLVLTISTAQLVAEHGDRIRLSHLNSGAVRHVNHTRGSDTFQPIQRFAHRKADWVAEIAVRDRVPITPGLVLGAEIWHPDGHHEPVLGN